MTNQEKLLPYYTLDEIKAYFGKRSDAELAEIVALMRRMTTEQRRKFKAALVELAQEATHARR
jgi:hypothetical protein